MPFDGTNLTEVQQTLIAARELIEKGWCKGALKRELKSGPKYCMIGALEWSTSNLDTCFESKDILASIINGESDRSIVEWNDAKERRKTHVLEAFDRAIIKAGENG